MKDHFICISNLHPLDPETISRSLNILLCNDATDPQLSASIMTSPNFKPDSFSVLDRMSNNAFLSEGERDFDQWLGLLVQRKLEALLQEGFIRLEALQGAADFCVDQVRLLLAISVGDEPVASILLNQELPFVIDRVLAFCLFGDPSFEIYTHRAFNAFARRVVPHIIQHRLWRKDICPEKLLLYSIASGLIGIDMKRSSPPLTDFIPFKPLLNESIESVGEFIWDKLNAFASRGFSFECWNAFSDQVLGQECNLVWFFDDYIESLFDLIFIQELMFMNQRLRVTLVPKNGRFDNDAAYGDITAFLLLPPFKELRKQVGRERLKISRHGPRMGTANLKKLSPELAQELQQCDCLFIKGSGIQEMFQGGIQKLCYTAYVLAREFNESESGFDARLGPLLFFQTEPGEYAFWGFKGRAIKRMMFADGREIAACLSTIREHEHRKRLIDPGEILREMQMLLKMQRYTGQEYAAAFNAELQLLSKKLVYPAAFPEGR
jgi:hypothetical protein